MLWFRYMLMPFHDFCASVLVVDLVVRLFVALGSAHSLPEQAKPIKFSSAPPEVAQLSTAPLTTPITPNLRTKRRAMNAPREPPAPIA